MNYKLIDYELGKIRDLLDNMNFVKDVNEIQNKFVLINKSIELYAGCDKKALRLKRDQLYKQMLDVKEMILRKEIIGESQNNDCLIDIVPENSDDDSKYQNLGNGMKYRSKLFYLFCRKCGSK